MFWVFDGGKYKSSIFTGDKHFEIVLSGINYKLTLFDFGEPIRTELLDSFESAKNLAERWRWRET